MPKSTTITCDSCKADLTTTGNCEDWRIALKNEPIPSVGGWVTAMAECPHLEHDCYFCSWLCLVQYVKKCEQQAEDAKKEFERTHEKVDLGGGMTMWKAIVPTVKEVAAAHKPEGAR